MSNSPMTDRRFSVLGVEITDVTTQRAIELVEKMIRRDEGRAQSVFFANAHTLNVAASDKRFREVLNQADCVFGDGTGVRWAARLQGIRPNDNLVGTDFVPALFRETANRGYSYFLLGADERTIRRAAASAARDFPGWTQAGFHHGYIRDKETADRVMNSVNAAHPDVVLVGMGNPLQEFWIHRHLDHLSARVCMGVGGLFDYWAGNVTRAPRLLRRLGHEWMWRIYQQPRDKAKRYLAGNPLFVWRVAKERVVGVAYRNGAPRPSPGAQPERTGAPAPEGAPARVTVVVPCYNEEPGAPQLMENLAAAARALRPSYDLQFVLVDDGSRDGTWEALHRAAAGRDGYTLLRHERNRGVAAAIMTGIRHAATEIVCSLDADCTYDSRQLAHMLPLLAEGVDLVTASPYHPLGRVRNVPVWRLFLSRQASFLYRRVMRQKLYTYTSCFRIYRRSAVLAVELDHDGFVGIAELLWRLDREGRRIVEYPAALGARRFGQSKMNKSAAICGHLRLLGRALGDRILHSRLPRKRRS